MPPEPLSPAEKGIPVVPILLTLGILALVGLGALALGLAATC